MESIHNDKDPVEAIPSDNTVISFPPLPVELVLVIFKAAATDFQTLRSLIRVSKAINQQFTPQLYHTVCFKDFVDHEEERLSHLNRTLRSSRNTLTPFASIRRLFLFEFWGTRKVVIEIILACPDLEKLAVSHLFSLGQSGMGSYCPAPRSIMVLSLPSMASQNPLLRCVTHLSIWKCPDELLAFRMPDGDSQALKQSMPRLTHFSFIVSKDEADVSLVTSIRTIASLLPHLTVVLVPYDDQEVERAWGEFWYHLPAHSEDLQLQIANMILIPILRFMPIEIKSLLEFWEYEDTGGNYREPGDRWWDTALRPV